MYSGYKKVWGAYYFHHNIVNEGDLHSCNISSGIRDGVQSQDPRGRELYAVPAAQISRPHQSVLFQE